MPPLSQIGVGAALAGSRLGIGLYKIFRPMAKLIDGTALAQQTKADVLRRAKELESKGRGVHLTAILVGSTPAGELYAQRQREACQSVGINYELRTLPAEATHDEVAKIIRQLNSDASVTGIMLHLPVPKHLNATELQYLIDPVKDVEGVNPANIGYVVYGQTLIAPCTALAATELIKSTGIEIRGAEAVVVGASQIAGRPISLLLTEQMATVTLCHIATKDLAAHTRRAEILVVAVGKPNLIGGDMIKPGAVVIDVGINRVTQPDGTKKTVGDVNFDEAKEVASHITPVPGGVGPMTVAMLLKNTLRSAELLHTAAARAH
jgi:methylenetetrahydrofolate dehydrogenase (NADP+)/methenyltetrahydrofolate cyclohydrolase